MEPLDRKTLSMRLADDIEQSIRHGKWSAQLPGHRTLMQSYAVSAKTCLVAISHLEARGVIATGEAGKRRSILIRSGQTARKLETLLVLESSTAQGGAEQSLQQMFRNAWSDTGGRVVVQRIDFPRYRHPTGMIREMVERHHADAILFHLSTSDWASKAMALRPVFLDGGERPSVEGYSGVAYELGIEIRGMVEFLQSRGHRRIAVPMDFIAKGFEKAIRISMAECLDLPLSSSELAELCPVFPERTPDAWRGYWRKLFSTVRPTAVILNKDIHVHSFYGFCTRQGISIPRDVSVVCMDNAEALEWCEPVPTRMRFPNKLAVDYFKKWIRSGCRPLGMKLLPLEYVEGETVAAPRR